MKSINIFSVNGVNIAVFGNRAINSFKELFDVLDSSFYQEIICSNSLFYTLYQTIKQILAILKNTRGVRQIVKSVIYIYKIERYNCNIVITSLYHDFEFQILSTVQKNKRYVGINEGYGHFNNEEEIFGLKWEDFRLQEFLVHGKWQKKILDKKCKNINKITVVGGLNNALYMQKRKPIVSNKKYDICIISNYKESYNNNLSNCNFYKNLSKVCIKLNLKVCFAGRYSDQTSLKECNYITKCFGSNISYYKHNNRSTYNLCDRSVISVGDLTTSLIESFGRGNKIIACNPSNLPQLDFPINGIWTLSKYDCDSIMALLQFFFSMDNNEWAEVSSNARDSLIHNGNNILPLYSIGKILFNNK